MLIECTETPVGQLGLEGPQRGERYRLAQRNGVYRIYYLDTDPYHPGELLDRTTQVRGFWRFFRELKEED